MNQSRPCPCGKLQILANSGPKAMFNPVRYVMRWRCFGCGANQDGPTLHIPPLDVSDREAWDEANRPVVETPAELVVHPPEPITETAP